MKLYAAKNLSTGEILLIQCESGPEKFLPFSWQTVGDGSEGNPYREEKVFLAELLGEISKDSSGQFELPDKYFRDCWREVSDEVVVDLPLAREQRMNEIRSIRDEYLLLTDAKYMEILSKGEDDTAIKALKASLRDVPENVDLEQITDLQELKDYDAFSSLDLSLIL